jgi:hypothetical protein
MKKEFVPYELALRLNELGFDEKCIMHWWKGKLSYYQMGDFSPTHTSAPIYSQAFRWFREKYKLNQLVTRLPKHYVGVIDSEDGIIQLFYQRHDTYEEAELACLEKLLEIVEQKEK